MDLDKPVVTALRLPCPHCATPNSGHASGTDPDRSPEDGDGSVCWRCGGLAVFVASPLGLALRIPTEAERADMLTWPVVIEHLEARRAAFILGDDPEAATTLTEMLRRHR